MFPAAVSCFSYLAATYTLHVDHYPKINYGVEVQSSDRFLAGDAPLVAGMLTAFGHAATLHSNGVGDDPNGRDVTARLHAWGVRHQNGATNSLATRVNTVVTDQAGHRTWFSGLAGITNELSDLNLECVVGADIIYLDCYEVLGDTPRPVLQAALAAGREVVVNLGGSPPPSWLMSAAGRSRGIGVLQTNADEDDPAQREVILRDLVDLQVADLVMVTAGRSGAVGYVDGAAFTTPADPVEVHQVQGAGAAFSAALIHARCIGLSPQNAARFACRAGSLWCSRTPHGPLPTLLDLETWAP